MNLTVGGSSLVKWVSPWSPWFSTGVRAQVSIWRMSANWLCSAAQEALLLKKLVDVVKFQQNFANPWRRMVSRIHIHFVCKSGRPQDLERSILIPIAKKGSTKECANHQTIALIFHASKVMLKILHARLQHCANQELPDVQAGFRKGRGTRIQLPTFTGLYRNQGNFRKQSHTVSSTRLKPLNLWIMTICGKLLERWE